MLIVRGGRWRVLHPAPLGNGIVQVEQMKILGVTIRSDRKTTTHVDEILAACTCSLYPLCILRAHGLSGDTLYQVTRATTINRILYAGPAWWGLASALDRERIERFCRKLERAGYVQCRLNVWANWAVARGLMTLGGLNINQTRNYWVSTHSKN